MMKDETVDSLPNESAPNQFTRREFVKAGAFLGGVSFMASGAPWLLRSIGGNGASGRYLKPTATYALAQPENVIYSTCLQCQIRCLIKVKQNEGTVVKIDGSPYSPKQLVPNIPYDTPLDQAVVLDGKLCPKGQAGVQTHYDPYRLRKVLKRAGARGAGSWQTIDFNQAVDEIVNGGDLFGEGPVTGLKDIRALSDASAASSMAADVDKLRKKEMTVAEFKSSHAAHLDTLINADYPDLGPKNNQFAFMPGRINRTRVDFAKRWLHDSFGSNNIFIHTSICELSIFVSTSELTRDLVKGGGKNHFKPDFLNSEFVIFWGTGYAEANFGLTAMAELVTRSVTDRAMKVAVIDPRLSKSAGKAWRWLPVKAGGDAALALGMIRWIIENDRFDRRYLENPNLAAAKEDGETTSTDATHLVRTDKMVFLKPEEAGLEAPASTQEGQPPPPGFVVLVDGQPVRHDLAGSGTLEVAATVNGIPVKSAFTLLKERALERSLEEYAELSGIDADSIVELADEFTSHGKKAAIDIYRGVAKHPNGFHIVQSVNTLNVLIGNQDWKGGLADGGGSRDDLGGKEGAPYALAKLHPGKTKKFGVPMTREGLKYEESTLFERDGGYPAKRPWYPFTWEMFQDAIPAAEAGYPYPLKALWIHMGTPVYSVPGGPAVQNRILRDPSIIPLVFATDVVIGETTMYADYIFPDLSYLEQWASPGDVPQPSVKSNPIRQPAAPPVPEIVTVAGEEMPISMEAVMLAIADRMKLPGFGDGGFGDGLPLKRPEDYYLKVVANLAFGEKADGSDAVPEASQQELDLFVASRRHLPSPMFDLAKWQAAVGPDLWKRAVYVLNRGGRFEPLSDAYKGDKMAHQFAGTFHLYIERVAKVKDSITGKPFDGLPFYSDPVNSKGEVIADDGYDMKLITYKEVFGTQSRTPGTYWSQSSLLPKNFVLVQKSDAKQMGLDDGDKVLVTSKSLPDGEIDLGNGLTHRMEGTVKVIEGIRPGVIGISHHYGHWAYGAQDVTVDGEKVAGDKRRGKGIAVNALMRLDDYTKTAPLTDPVGGSAVFNDTSVRLQKA
jgi:anaerobic selenocysteine-containing dehydrogenase